MVTIKNYRMPHNCYDCDLHNYHECNLTSESIEEDYCWNGDSREKHCPLREVEAIPKDQYENRLKADMVAMLTEIQLEIEELNNPLDYDFEGYNQCAVDCEKLIQQKIDALREVVDDGSDTNS
jgi:hypothetical protein